MTAYYNELDKHAAAWLRELITAGQLPLGDVDERSIEDVKPNELIGYTQCHFFAGIGGWPLALRLAGWPDDRPVWTGSCPCQPFSAAGKGAGFDDERHLWPSFQWLIQQCRPPVVFGEQVASKAVDVWIDLVQADLEALGYAFGAVAFPAAGIGAPHIRDRAYWVAHGSSEGLQKRISQRRIQRQTLGAQQRQAAVCSGDSGGLADAESQQYPNGQAGLSDEHDPSGREQSAAAVAGLRSDNSPGPTNGHWRTADWLLCRDGKWRPVEPGTFPLVDGLPRGVVPGCDPGAPGYAENTPEARVMRLNGYGNAIVPQQAAEFILAANLWLCL